MNGEFDAPTKHWWANTKSTRPIYSRRFSDFAHHGNMASFDWYVLCRRGPDTIYLNDDDNRLDVEKERVIPQDGYIYVQKRVLDESCL